MSGSRIYNLHGLLLDYKNGNNARPMTSTERELCIDNILIFSNDDINKKSLKSLSDRSLAIMTMESWGNYTK